MSGELDQKHLLSLEGLQTIMQSIAKCCTRSEKIIVSPITRSHIATTPIEQEQKSNFKLLSTQIKVNTSPETLKEMKRVKELVVTGISIFNRNPKEGLKFLQGFQKKNKKKF